MGKGGENRCRWYSKQFCCLLCRHIGGRYVYAEDTECVADEGNETPDALSPAALAALPAALRDALKEAVAEIDRDRMDELLADLSS